MHSLPILLIEPEDAEKLLSHQIEEGSRLLNESIASREQLINASSKFVKWHEDTINLLEEIFDSTEVVKGFGVTTHLSHYGSDLERLSLDMLEPEYRHGVRVKMARLRLIKDLVPRSEGSKEVTRVEPWTEGLRTFQKDHDGTKTVFIMMKFQGGSTRKDRKLAKLYKTLKLTLDKYGLEVVRADEKNYSTSNWIWENVQIYANGCDFGIAVLENLYQQEFNPNVAMEFGYMLAKNKKVLLLKAKDFTNIRADLLGRIWKEFDVEDMNTVNAAVRAWMVDLGKAAIKT